MHRVGPSEPVIGRVGNSVKLLITLIVVSWVSSNASCSGGKGGNGVPVAPRSTGAPVARETMIVTGYSSTVDQADSTPFIAASGDTVFDGMVAQNNLPFGTLLQIPNKYGKRVFEVKDRMNERYTNAESGFRHLDIWFSSREEAEAFGVDTLPVFILRMGPEGTRPPSR